MAEQLFAGALYQVAWVVRDIAAAERFFCEAVGVKRFFHLENLRAMDVEGTYHGKPGDWMCHLYFGYAGETQVELIQHVSGASIFGDFLSEHGDGVQHVGYQVDDAAYDDAARQLESGGYPCVQSLRTPLGRGGYFDTRSRIGVVTELVGLTEAGREFFRNLRTGKY